MNLSRGAKKCLNKLRSYGPRAYPFQRTLAQAFDCDVRTIKRYTQELREAGFIDVVRRGPTSAYYRLLDQQVTKQNVPSCGFVEKPVENSTKRGQNVPSFVPSNVPSSPPDLITEGFELNLEESKLASRDPTPLELPAPTITNECGRVDRNPDYEYLRRVLYAARHRIRRADNPAAYERRILRDGLAQLAAWNGTSAAASGRQERAPKRLIVVAGEATVRPGSCFPLEEGDRESFSGEVATIPAPPHKPPRREERYPVADIAISIAQLAQAKAIGRRL